MAIDYNKYIKPLGMILALLVIFLGIFRYCSNQSNNKDKIYRIARDPTWYPLQMMDKERSFLVFSNEVIQIIASDEKFKVELYTNNYDNLFINLDNEEYDGILSGLSPDLLTRKGYLFSEPIYRIGSVLVVRASSTFNSLSDMEGRLIGLATGTTGELKLNQYPSILIISYDNIVQALSDLNHNIIDGVIMRHIPAYIYTTGLYTNKLKVVGEPLNDDAIRLIAKPSRSGKELINIFDKGLKNIKEDGTYIRLLIKWGLINTEPEEKQTQIK